MILVDTGVLIDFLRTKDAKLGALFQGLPVAICGVVRAEILAGARGAADRQRLVTFLTPFRPVSTLESIWDKVGDTLSTLGAVGIIVPLCDALLATLAIENDIELWARDPHFRIIQQHVPALKFFQEPP
jgi:predicted nucleic acid-binding protein